MKQFALSLLRRLLLSQRDDRRAADDGSSHNSGSASCWSDASSTSINISAGGDDDNDARRSRARARDLRGAGTLFGFLLALEQTVGLSLSVLTMPVPEIRSKGLVEGPTDDGFDFAAQILFSLFSTSSSSF